MRMKVSGSFAAVAVALALGSVALADTVTIGNLGNLPPGKTVTIKYDALVHPVPAGTTQLSTQGTVGWNSSLTGQTDDPDTGAAGDATITTIVAAPDVIISKTDSTTLAAPGSLHIYTLTIGNIGTRGASGVVVTEGVPAGTTFTSASSSVGWNCVASTCTHAVGAPNVEVGQTYTLAFAVTVNTPPGVSSITNTASVVDDGTNGADSNTGNNIATDIDAVATPTPTSTSTPTATSTPAPTPTPAAIGLERTHLNFGVVKNGSTLIYVTPPQRVGLSLPGGAWTTSVDQPWVSVTPPNGGSPTLLSIQISSGNGLPAAGAASTATITITAPGATNSPQQITVDVVVYAQGTTAPFGSLDTPTNNLTGAHGAFAVTGWALDDIGVTKVQIYRDLVAGDPPPAPNGKTYIGDATFVSGQRPDIDASHPTWPLNYRAAWGYLMLTNMLPDLNLQTPAGGNGTFTLYAYATDVEGTTVLLGARTFTCANATATQPFGTIDTPMSGETVTGQVNNFGWVLTAQPSFMPTNGSTIHMFIDGVQQPGSALYNLPRSDVATLFPGYANTAGPVGYFSFDSTGLANGLHTIFWVATDNNGHTDGIGSRFFWVLN
jgi:uncharacterized repeat protein (TIGR01451 family)